MRIESSPLLLPQHDAALGADEIGGIRLDRRRVVELRGDRSRLAGEEVVSVTGFQGASGVPESSCTSAPSRRACARSASSGCHTAPRARVRPRRDRRCRRVPHAVNEFLHPGRACLHRRHGRCGREAEVVVTVPVHRHLVVEALDDLVDEDAAASGVAMPRCRRQRPPARRPRRRSRDPADELEVGAC